MQPIAIQSRNGEPTFQADPVAWFAWAGRCLGEGDRASVHAEPPVVHQGFTGRRWRLIRTARGIEVRPDLGGSAVFRTNHNPQITAIQIEDRVVVELCSVEGRWSGEFGLEELDVAELGRAMLEERHLPHDNLRFLFGRLDP